MLRDALCHGVGGSFGKCSKHRAFLSPPFPTGPVCFRNRRCTIKDGQRLDEMQPEGDVVKRVRSLVFISTLLLIPLASFLASPHTAQAKKNNHAQAEKDSLGASEEQDRSEDRILGIGRLFDGVRIHSPLGDEFNELYSRNQTEIHGIVDRNPTIIWETVEIALDLLPALRSVDQNGGKLCVNKQLYAKATDFFWRCKSLASPQLAGDLMKAKTLVESRTTELNAQQLLIDLNK